LCVSCTATGMEPSCFLLSRKVKILKVAIGGDIFYDAFMTQRYENVPIFRVKVHKTNQALHCCKA
jgi:hypothetical protein